MNEEKLQRVQFTFSVQMELCVPADWDEEMVRFHMEENHCNQNHVDTLAEWSAEHPGLCRVCCHSKVEVTAFGLEPVPMDGPWPEVSSPASALPAGRKAKLAP